jgi:hypothetical protein
VNHNPRTQRKPGALDYGDPSAGPGGQIPVVRTGVWRGWCAPSVASGEVHVWGLRHGENPARLASAGSADLGPVEDRGLSALGPRRFAALTSTRPFGRGDSLPGLPTYVDALGRITLLTTDWLARSLLGGLGEDDIWVSDLVGGLWSEPRNLSDVNGAPPVNTAFFDHCLSVSVDGNQAFWTSHVPAGSAATTSGPHAASTASGSRPRISDPRSTGRKANTTRFPPPTAERSTSPATVPADSAATTSTSPPARRMDILGAWPNAGPMLNGPGNDRCGSWTPNGKIFLFDSDRAGGFGSKDLWWAQARR